MDKISIKEGLKLLGYELTESDYSFVIDAAYACITTCDGDTSIIEIISNEKKRFVGFIYCIMPMDAEIATSIIECFFRMKKMSAFM